MMFPEDALYDYDKKYQDTNNHGKSISDVLIEAKESVSKPFGEIFNESEKEAEKETDEKTVEDSDINPVLSEPEISSLSDIDKDEKVEESSISDLLNNESNNFFPFEIDAQDLKDDLVKPDEDKEESSDVPSFISEPEVNPFKVEETNEETPINEKESMMDLFKRLGLSEIMFVESELEDLMNLEDTSIVEKNVNVLNKNNINLDIVSDNVNILSDPELEEKINVIIEAGKTVDDIYFNPSVLKKYDLKGLENAINLLKENGLDPKKVPLMAY